MCHNCILRCNPVPRGPRPAPGDSPPSYSCNRIVDIHATWGKWGPLTASARSVSSGQVCPQGSDDSDFWFPKLVWNGDCDMVGQQGESGREYFYFFHVLDGTYTTLVISR